MFKIAKKYKNSNRYETVWDGDTALTFKSKEDAEKWLELPFDDKGDIHGSSINTQVLHVLKCGKEIYTEERFPTYDNKGQIYACSYYEIKVV